METNYAVIDTEWNPLTGEFFNLGVKFYGKPVKSFGREQLYGKTARKIKLKGHWKIYYYYAVRDIQCFLMKYEGDFEFRDIYHMLRLSPGNKYSNISTYQENKARLPNLHYLWQTCDWEHRHKIIDGKHVYTRYTPALKTLVERDVAKTNDVLEHFNIPNLQTQEVLHKWSRNALNYITVNAPVKMEPSYLARINSPTYLQSLVTELEGFGCNAFSVKTIVSKGLDNGLPTLSLKKSNWLAFCEKMGWSQFITYEKRQDNKIKPYAQLHKDDFAPSLDLEMNVRATESGNTLETLIHLVTIIRTGHMRFDNIVPLVHPHHTNSGRSGQNKSPYVSGGLVRSNIYAGDGRAIVSVDLKSQEFCIAAAASDCPGMWNLAEHDDPYIQLAGLFNVDPATAGKGMENRDLVKVPLLQMLYGGGETLVFQNVDAFKEERRFLMRQLKDRFPQYFMWADEQLALGEERGYMELNDGFKLWLESDTMNPKQCVNMLIQGRAASVMPYWMDEVNKVIPKTAYISAELYDGLYVNCELSDVDTVIEALKETVTVWDKHIPLHRPWACEIVENQETHEPFHIHGVKEKKKYLKMDKVFEMVDLNARKR